MLRFQRKSALKEAENLYNNMLIVSSQKPTDTLFQNLSLEQKAVEKFLKDSRDMEK